MSESYFERRERALLGDRFDALYAAPADTAARGVTVSALRCSPQRFAALADFPLEPSPFCGAGFAVAVPDFKPGRHPYHHAGAFYSQEPSASSAAPLLGVQPGMRVLDLCAAPGGKTSQLAAALQGRGLLVSNEYMPARAEILRQNLERMGVTNAVVLNEEPARIAAALPEFFDRILVDAPCSGEGMFRKEPEALRQHSEALVAQCAALGAQILDAAAAALAPGGELVYSTCTFAPAEDETQVGAFLARHPEFTLLPALEHAAAPFGHPGEANRCGAHPFDVSLVRRIWPCDGGEGHFIARFRKAGGAEGVLPAAAGESAPAAQPQRPVWQLDPARAAEEAAWLAAQCAPRPEKKGKPQPELRGGAKVRTGRARYDDRGGWDGFDAARRKGRAEPAGKAASQGEKAVRAAWQQFAAESFPALADRPVTVQGDSVYLPVPFPAVRLHILRCGVFAGRVQNGRFVPEHPLFAAYGAQCANAEPLTLADPRTAQYLLGGEIEARAAQNGWCCVMVDGFPLGGGKVSAGRVKNHYPKALRNLK